jgi:hypothetical protein
MARAQSIAAEQIENAAAHTEVAPREWPMVTAGRHSRRDLKALDIRRQPFHP